MNRKIAFFDIDGTLTSELDGSILPSTKRAIKKAHENGHLMFINTGRCMQNVEARFLELGFDGIVSGCGTNIYCNENGHLTELLYVSQTHAVTHEILTHARRFALDLLFEGRDFVQFDFKTPLLTEGGKQLYNAFLRKHYDMSQNPEDTQFACDKFVVWFTDLNDLPAFRQVSDNHFDCIDRGGNFREFVPKGYSKATGIQYVLDHYQIARESSYSFGDSNNDLPMLSYTHYSIAMGNAEPASLFDQVTFVSAKSSENGIWQALEHYGFF